MNASEPDSVQPTDKSESIGISKDSKPGKKVRKRPLTIKEIKYLENRKKGMGKVDSALEAGYSKGTATKSAAKIEKNILDQMDAAGLTAEYLLKKVFEGLEADRPYGKFGDLHADYSTRHKYVSTALQMRNMLEPQPQYDTKVNIIVNSKEVQLINQQFVEFVMQHFGGK